MAIILHTALNPLSCATPTISRRKRCGWDVESSPGRQSDVEEIRMRYV
jgi:hypothetical protein